MTTDLEGELDGRMMEDGVDLSLLVHLCVDHLVCFLVQPCDREARLLGLAILDIEVRVLPRVLVLRLAVSGLAVSGLAVSGLAVTG
jgi:hypothetical protein